MPIMQAPYNGYPYGDYVKYVLNEPDHQFTIDELAAVLSINDLSLFAPGTDYHYSDTGYSLLAKIIERVSGKNYDRFIADNLLTPMGLSGTTAPWSAHDILLPEPFLAGLARVDSTADFEDTTEFNMSDQVGPWNLISTSAGMAAALNHSRRWEKVPKGGKVDNVSERSNLLQGSSSKS